jgi:hypothetical protein
MSSYHSNSSSQEQRRKPLCNQFKVGSCDKAACAFKHTECTNPGCKPIRQGHCLFGHPWAIPEGRPHRLYPWAGVDATRKSAAFVRGKLEVLRPLVQYFNPNNYHAIKDGIGALVLIRLRPGCVARFCREGSLQSDFSITGQFPLQMSGDIYICKGDGVIQEVEVGTVISPSSATTMPMIGDTGGGQIFQEELKRLAGEGTDEYVLGVWYTPSDKNPIGDIQPYISETADYANESWTDIIFRGLQEEAQITLSDARRGELAGNFKGPFGYSRHNITNLATRVLHVVEIPILHGLRTDYTIHADASKLAGGGQQTVEVKVEKMLPAAETTRMTVSSVANEESEAGHRAADTAVPLPVDRSIACAKAGGCRVAAPTVDPKAAQGRRVVDAAAGDVWTRGRKAGGWRT